MVLLRFHQKAFKKWKRNRWSSGRYKITNNGEIIFTYAEARELGIRSDRTILKVFREVIEDLGFIDMVDCQKRSYIAQEPIKYAISDGWRKYGTPQYQAVKIPRVLAKGAGFPKKENKKRCSPVQPYALHQNRDRSI